MKYNIGNQVTIVKMEDVEEKYMNKYVGEVGKVIKIAENNAPWIYKIEFINENLKSEWFSEDELSWYTILKSVN